MILNRVDIPSAMFYKGSRVRGQGQGSGEEKILTPLNGLKPTTSVVKKKELGGEHTVPTGHCLIIQSHGYEWVPQPDP